MASVTPELIEDVIAEAPAWCKIALTVPNERLRGDAHAALAQYVYEALYHQIVIDLDQLALPL